MKNINKILKIFAFISIIKASFLVSFAFLGDDLGLDLYKNIDKGVGKLNSQMYSYELKGAKPDGKISDNINKKIKQAGFSNCKLADLTQEDVYKISFGEKNNVNKSGDISLLAEKLDGKCLKYDQLNTIQQIITDTAITSNKTAKSKSDDIYNISKQGLFSDGNIQNSPFDIVKDIKDIDYIIFTQEIDYEGTENIDDDKIGEYIQGKLDGLEDKSNEEVDNLEDKINGNSHNNSNKNSGNNNKTNNNQINTDNTNTIDNNVDNDINNNQMNNNNSENIVDNMLNNYNNCPENINESGLLQNEINKVLNGQNNNGNNYGVNNNNNNNINGQNRNIPINSNYRRGPKSGDNPFSFSTSGNYSIGTELTDTIGKIKYKENNDNDFFGGCEDFFCINIDFLTHNGNLLIGGETRSIESIMERSNEHLKKFANSSLVQAKMTTNNFELSLRDLNLSNIFSMPIVIIKKTPPILDLDFFNKKVETEKKKNNPNPFGWENLLKFRFDSAGMNIDRENDLAIFEDMDSNIKNTINNAELSISQAKINSDERNKKINEIKELDEHITRVINSSYQEKESDGVYKEFLELEMFAGEIKNYVKGFDKAATKMIDIPIHP